MRNRLISWLLAASMTISLFPTLRVNATDIEETDDQQEVLQTIEDDEAVSTELFSNFDSKNTHPDDAGVNAEPEALGYDKEKEENVLSQQALPPCA